MVTHILDTAAAKALSVYVIVKRGAVIADVKAHFSASTCTVEIRHYRNKGKPETLPPFQRGQARGGGYDKFTAALSGLVVDGHKMSDHCDEQKPLPRGRKAWPRDAKAPPGFSFANFSNELGGYRNCYRDSGLTYLEARGYTVHSVL